MEQKMNSVTEVEVSTSSHTCTKPHVSSSPFVKLHHADCFDVFPSIADKSVDMILADLPYGTTQCKWDAVLDFQPLWLHYERIIKESGAIVLFCQQPFTSALISSNFDLFKYMLYWRKSRPSGHVNAKLKPLKDIEEIAIFSKATTANGAKNNMVYNPQGLVKVDKVFKRPKSNVTYNGVSPIRKNHHKERPIEYEGYPRQVLDYEMHNVNLLHPTQKPVALMEYLIKTYTNEGETVLDNCMGSGTTGVAAVNLNRNFIGIEKEEKYFKIAVDRINGVLPGCC